MKRNYQSQSPTIVITHCYLNTKLIHDFLDKSWLKPAVSVGFWPISLAGVARWSTDSKWWCCWAETCPINKGRVEVIVVVVVVLVFLFFLLMMMRWSWWMIDAGWWMMIMADLWQGLFVVLFFSSYCFSWSAATLVNDALATHGHQHAVLGSTAPAVGKSDARRGGRSHGNQSVARWLSKRYPLMTRWGLGTSFF